MRSGSSPAAASSEGEEWSCKALVLLSVGGSWPSCSPCPAVAGVSSVPLGLTWGHIGAFCSGLEGNPHPDALLCCGCPRERLERGAWVGAAPRFPCKERRAATAVCPGALLHPRHLARPLPGGFLGITCLCRQHLSP